MNEREVIAKVTGALDAGADGLSPSTLDALRAGRRRALAARRQHEPGRAHGHTLALDWIHHHGKLFWASLLLLAIVLGWAAYQMSNDQDASDMDIQLLTDDLPPQAYIHGDMNSWLNSRER